MKFAIPSIESLNDSSSKRKAIMEFFKTAKAPTVDDINKLAASLKISIDELNEEIYLCLSCFTSGGRANAHGSTVADFESKEIDSGVDIESEHVDINNPYARMLQLRITLDHLTEIKDYNTRLLKMEAAAVEDGSTEAMNTTFQVTKQTMKLALKIYKKYLQVKENRKQNKLLKRKK